MAIMVKDPYHATFIHIAKTGGSSVTVWLKSNFDVYTTKTKMGADVYQTKQVFDTDNIGWTFCTVRNPWRIAVSWYSFLCLQNQGRIKHVLDNGILSHKKKHNLDYLYAEKSRLEKGFEKWVTYGLRTPLWKKAQQCDYVMKLETIHRDFKEVQKRLGCYNVLPHLMRSDVNRPSWHSYYTNQETKDIVANHYKKDIELYGYDFS